MQQQLIKNKRNKPKNRTKKKKEIYIALTSEVLKLFIFPGFHNDGADKHEGYAGALALFLVNGKIDAVVLHVRKSVSAIL